jgi:hypothetical protein
LRAIDVQNMAALRQRLTNATTMDELHALCREYSEALGFQHFVYALRVPTHFADARLIMVDGYPPGWVKHYFEQHHFDAEPVRGLPTLFLKPSQADRCRALVQARKT